MPIEISIRPIKIVLPVRLCEVIPFGQLPNLIRYDPSKTWYRPSAEVKAWLINSRIDHDINILEYYTDGAIVQIATMHEAAIMKLAFNLGEKDE
jgi:hypothetical protein